MSIPRGVLSELKLESLRRIIYGIADNGEAKNKEILDKLPPEAEFLRLSHIKSRVAHAN